MKFRWMGGAATGEVRSRLARNLRYADAAIAGRARELTGTPGPPRSEPGESPHMDSDRLHDSIYDEVDGAGLISLIGSTEEHAVYTEIGTPDMDPRPWLTPAILDTADQAARELAR